MSYKINSDHKWNPVSELPTIKNMKLMEYICECKFDRYKGIYLDQAIYDHLRESRWKAISIGSFWRSLMNGDNIHFIDSMCMGDILDKKAFVFEEDLEFQAYDMLMFTNQGTAIDENKRIKFHIEGERFVCISSIAHSVSKYKGQLGHPRSSFINLYSRKKSNNMGYTFGFPLVAERSGRRGKIILDKILYFNENKGLGVRSQQDRKPRSKSDVEHAVGYGEFMWVNAVYTAHVKHDELDNDYRLKDGIVSIWRTIPTDDQESMKIIEYMQAEENKMFFEEERK